jgi:hypothetical protein
MNNYVINNIGYKEQSVCFALRQEQLTLDVILGCKANDTLRHPWPFKLATALGL